MHIARAVFSVALMLVALSVVSILTTSSAVVDAQAANCICTDICFSGTEPLDRFASFRARIADNNFDRGAFRRAIASWLGISRFDVVDRKMLNDSYTFGFTPTGAASLSSAAVCNLNLLSFRLLSVHSCCIHNTTKFSSGSGGGILDDGAHTIKLIVCWVVLALATAYTVYVHKKDGRVKDVAMDSAIDLACQKDEDEE